MQKLPFKLLYLSLTLTLATNCTKIIVKKPLKPAYTCKPVFVNPELKHIDGAEALVANYRNLLDYIQLQHKLLDNTIVCYENVIEAVTEKK